MKGDSQMDSYGSSIANKTKPSRKSLLAGLELVPEGDKPFRRSRTGCLTCRKRKKKCPEQYDKGTCLRCKSGGWRCIREEDLAPKENTTMDRRESVSNINRVSPAGPSNSSSSIAGHDNSVSRPNDNNALESSVAESCQNTLTLLGSPLDTQPVSSLPNVTSPLLIDDSLWTTQSLDAILGASLPTFDLSMYGGFGQDDTDPFHFSPVFDFEMSEDPSLPNPSLDSVMSFPDRRDPQSMAGAPSPLQGDYLLLSEFYEQYILPAWTVTYPDKVRKAVTARYYEITNAHHVTRLCRVAAAAVYLTLLLKRCSHHIICVGYNSSPLDTFPPRYLSLSVDAESILREATLLVRSPRDVNITMEAHFWALSDLHMAVGSFCDSSKAYAIMDLAERLLSITYGQHPDIDFLSLNAYCPFYMRAFGMIDLNRSICQRRPTFFNFVDVVGLNQTLHLNDGSHDQWFGLPAGLALHLSRLSNLIARLRNTDMPAEEVVRQAGLIESDIRSYRSPFAVTDSNFDRHPQEWGAEISVETEVWRNVGLLLLWREVRKFSILRPEVRDCLSLLLNLIKSLQYLSLPRTTSENNVIDFWSLNYTAPTFLVGAMSTRREDRAFCKQLLTRLGPEKNLEDMILALESTWAATDREGQVVDWFDECARLDLSVTFF